MHRQFCYLPTIFYRLNFFLCWKESQLKFHAKKKTTKWPTKLPIKRNAKGKKRRARKQNRNRFAKKIQILAHAHARKNKKSCLINYIQLEEIEVLVAVARSMISFNQRLIP